MPRYVDVESRYVNVESRYVRPESFYVGKIGLFLDNRCYYAGVPQNSMRKTI